MEDAPRYPPRLGKNVGSYQGETIDIEKLLRDVDEVARKTGWQSVPLLVPGSDAAPGRDVAPPTSAPSVRGRDVAPSTSAPSVPGRDAAPPASVPLPAFQRLSPSARKNLYISSGMHGDEPAGPLAVLRLFEENDWPEHVNIFLIPCFNPGGFIRNTRENEDGVDLNRDYRAGNTALVRTHIQWLQQRPQFDLSLCLHEDWESHGFYLYELNPDLRPSVAEHIINRVKKVCPIDTSALIEGREARNGIICANRYLIERPDWPEAFYLIHHKTRLSYTLEAPSDFPLLTRVNALATGVRAVLEALQT